MNTSTLYLKYRPATLDEIVGQEELVKVLKNGAKTDNISHAYLFSGGRGTGKTTTARAFAKELEIHKDDILELDAASNNGVDEIKAITDSVYTLPYFSKYKMYILDEAHMLTKAASNAFLKTLEEPPKHCIFVLCTTDPEKLLETILSRCTKFNLKSPSIHILEKFLETVLKKEEVKMAKETIGLLAMSGDGSYRDTLSNLQKVLSFKGEKYTDEFVAQILGMPTIESVFGYLYALDEIEGKEGTKQAGIDILKKVESQGVDPKLFSKQITYFCRLVILFRYGLLSDKEILVTEGENVWEHIKLFKTRLKVDVEKKFSGRINREMLMEIIKAEISSKNSSLPFLVYEVLLF